MSENRPTHSRSAGAHYRAASDGYDSRTGTSWIVAEHGLDASRVRNIQADPRVRVKIGLRRRTGTATLLPGDDPARRQHILAQQGTTRRVTAAAVRLFATDLLSIRVDLEAGRGPEARPGP